MQLKYLPLLNADLCPAESGHRLNSQLYCVATWENKNMWKEEEAWGWGWNRFYPLMEAVRTPPPLHLPQLPIPALKPKALETPTFLMNGDLALFSNFLGLSFGVQCGPFYLGSTKPFCFLCLFYNISNRNKIQQLNFQSLSHLGLSMTTFHHIQQTSQQICQNFLHKQLQVLFRNFPFKDLLLRIWWNCYRNVFINCFWVFTSLAPKNPFTK